MRIESIYEQTNKNRITPTVLLVKEENVEDDIADSESSVKCEPIFWDDSVEGTS